jgi:hypothetical protein
MKKIYLLTTLILSLIFTGCIRDISPQGLTVSIPASSITKSLEEQFPRTQSFQYGKIHLSNPKALLHAGTDRVVAGTSIGYSSSLIPLQQGSLYVSGVPYFDAQSGNVYLRQPNIDKLEFNGYKLSSFLQGPLKDAIMPVVNEVFRTTPIYKINRSTLQGSFINNIRVSNGELLVTFGL